MASNFNNYADYYDLIYSDKNYIKEADFVFDLLNKFSPKKLKAILSLGCGSGSHDFEFGKKGITTVGVDLSQTMIDYAESKKNLNKIPNVNFIKGDIREVDLDQKFDAVISLFHVFNYLTSNDDLRKGMLTANKHLVVGSPFIFDSWFGPAVLNDKPKSKSFMIENEKLKLIRITTPTMHYAKNIVDVCFDLIIQDKKTQKWYNETEIHPMRYLFLPELELLCEQTGFELMQTYKWLTTEELNENSWYSIFILKKIK